MSIEDKIEYNPQTGKLNWKSGKKQEAGTKDRYIKIVIDGKQYLAHRLAWYLVYGKWPKEIDHINRKKHDNRLCNLREITHSENKVNATAQYNSATGIRGVRKVVRASSIRFRVELKKDGKIICGGSFKTLEEAIEAVSQLRRTLWPNL
jgi:HNH endonuclease